MGSPPGVWRGCVASPKWEGTSVGTNATTISSGSRPNRARRGAASYDNGLEAHNDTRPAHACVRPSCPSCPVTSTVAERHFSFNDYPSPNPDPFHACYDMRGNLTKKVKDFDGTYEYSWSSADNLTKFYWQDWLQQSEKTVEYKYDFRGQRVAKQVVLVDPTGAAW